MPAHTSIVDLILSASLVVQLVMLLLVAASVAPGDHPAQAAVLARRSPARTPSRAPSGRAGTLGDLSGLTRAGAPASDMAGLFEAGFREFRRLSEQAAMPADQVLEGVRRAMHVARCGKWTGWRRACPPSPHRVHQSLRRPLRHGLGHHEFLPWPGNVQSATSPRWHRAFPRPSSPPHRPFAAIPAVIAYNRYADKVSRLEVRYDSSSRSSSASCNGTPTRGPVGGAGAAPTAR